MNFQAPPQGPRVVTREQDDKHLFLNKSYVTKTAHGYMKIAQICVSLLSFICVMSAGFPMNSTHEANFISFVSICGLMISAILLFLYFINAVVYFTMINWVLFEFGYTIIWTLFNLIAGFIAVVFTIRYVLPNHAFEVAAFFLFVATGIYGFSAFKSFMLQREGVRLVIVTTETTTISPA